jgi:hypothetical protein
VALGVADVAADLALGEDPCRPRRSGTSPSASHNERTIPNHSPLVIRHQNLEASVRSRGDAAELGAVRDLIEAGLNEPADAVAALWD